MWENNDLMIENWSIQTGIDALLWNFIVYLCIAIVVEIMFNIELILSFLFYRKVTFINSNEGVLEVKGLKERWGKDKVSYNFKIEKSNLVCIIGENSAKKTNLLEMLAGSRHSVGSLEIRDSDFFADGNKPKMSQFMAYRPSEVILDSNMTAI